MCIGGHMINLQKYLNVVLELLNVFIKCFNASNNCFIAKKKRNRKEKRMKLSREPPG